MSIENKENWKFKKAKVAKILLMIEVIEGSNKILKWKWKAEKESTWIGGKTRNNFENSKELKKKMVLEIEEVIEWKEKYKQLKHKNFLSN